MERLVSAILIKAVQDWDKPELQPDVEQFISSEWFDFLAGCVDLDPAKTRDQFINRSYKRVSMRAGYRKSH
jgi:hypothetical protein